MHGNTKHNQSAVPESNRQTRGGSHHKTLHCTTRQGNAPRYTTALDVSFGDVESGSSPKTAKSKSGSQLPSGRWHFVQYSTFFLM